MRTAFFYKEQSQTWMASANQKWWQRGAGVGQAQRKPCPRAIGIKEQSTAEYRKVEVEKDLHYWRGKLNYVLLQ